MFLNLLTYRGICTIKTSYKFQSLKHPTHCKQSFKNGSFWYCGICDVT